MVLGLEHRNYVWFDLLTQYSLCLCILTEQPCTASKCQFFQRANICLPVSFSIHKGKRKNYCLSWFLRGRGRVQENRLEWVKEIQSVWTSVFIQTIPRYKKRFSSTVQKQSFCLSFYFYLIDFRESKGEISICCFTFAFIRWFFFFFFNFYL